jgi:hypothetical protein
MNISKVYRKSSNVKINEDRGRNSKYKVKRKAKKKIDKEGKEINNI